MKFAIDGYASLDLTRQARLNQKITSFNIRRFKPERHTITKHIIQLSDPLALKINHPDRRCEKLAIYRIKHKLTTETEEKNGL